MPTVPGVRRDIRFRPSAFGSRVWGSGSKTTQEIRVFGCRGLGFFKGSGFRVLPKHSQMHQHLSYTPTPKPQTFETKPETHKTLNPKPEVAIDPYNL